MQVSKKKLNQNIQKQIEGIFFKLISDIRTESEAKVVFWDLLSKTEQQAIVKRIAIAIFLDKGRSYENIKSYLKVSSATIASVNEKMGDPGIQLALQKIKAEEWAEDWVEKIGQFVENIFSSK
ncbi:Trp family transcriptional regulator [Patescibacteria group bacterium]